MEEFKVNDIVELMSIDIDRGNEGYYRNQYNMIPKVGDRFRVSFVHEDAVSVYTYSSNMILRNYQIFLYHRSK